MIDRAHQFSYLLPTEKFDTLLKVLEDSQAFFEPHEGKLILPSL